MRYRLHDLEICVNQIPDLECPHCGYINGIEDHDREALSGSGWHVHPVDYVCQNQTCRQEFLCQSFYIPLGHAFITISCLSQSLLMEWEARGGLMKVMEDIGSKKL
jgi:hypothetical protein